MTRRIIDLSVTLTDRVKSDPPGLGPNPCLGHLDGLLQGRGGGDRGL